MYQLLKAMISAATLLEHLPPFMGNVVMLRDEQTLDDIVTALKMRHKADVQDYDLICMYFYDANQYEIGRYIFDFLKSNVRYDEEGEESQTVRTPGAIISTGKTIGADCKNYALFTGGILDALNRRGAQIDWCYRFAEYNSLGGDTSNHVFVVVNPGADEIWIDAVLDSYDTRDRVPDFFTDKKIPMALYSISGVGNTAAVAPAPVYAWMNDRDNYGAWYLPVNLAGKSTNTAQAYGLMLANLQNEADNEIKSGKLRKNTERWNKYQTTIDNVVKKIAAYEQSYNWNFGDVYNDAVGGGILDTIFGKDKMKALQQLLPAIALDFMYLYIPMTEPGYEGFYAEWCPNRTHNYWNVMPKVVGQKMSMAGKTSWHWGEWASFHPESDLYPLMTEMLTKLLGMPPWQFWSQRLGLAITEQDCGVFAGLMGSNNSGVPSLADTLLQAVNATGKDTETFIDKVKGIIESVFSNVLKPEMLYSPDTFGPNTSDWTGSTYHPIPDGWPPKIGYFKPTIDGTNPGNPVPGVGSGGGSGMLYIILAAAALALGKKKSTQRA